MAQSTGILGSIAGALGDEAQALDLYQEALALFRDADMLPGIIEALGAIAQLFARQGHYEQAARLLGTIAAASRAIHRRPTAPREREALEGAQAEVRAALGEGRFRMTWYEGEAMSLER